jgi:hypothetical protein
MRLTATKDCDLDSIDDAAAGWHDVTVDDDGRPQTVVKRLGPLCLRI